MNLSFSSVDSDPLTKEEKEFIIQWIKDNLGPNDEIKWKDLISAMEAEFNTLRSENKPKNYWYSLKRNFLSKIPQQVTVQLGRLQILTLLANDQCGI